MIRSPRLLGVRVDRVSMADALEQIGARLRAGPPGYIVTLNAAMLRHAIHDAKFARIVDSAALVTPDGMGTLLVGRILGTPFPERVAGVDLTGRACALCAGGGYRVFLLGAQPGVADLAARRLAAQYPGLVIAGSHHGYFGPERDAAIADTVKNAKADLLLVALGAPRQEAWLARWLPHTGARVGIGVGGSLDVYAGRSPLAPQWLRDLGLEWLYRLVREPRRWRVVAALPEVILLAVKERFRRLRG